MKKGLEGRSWHIINDELSVVLKEHKFDCVIVSLFKLHFIIIGEGFRAIVRECCENPKTAR